MIAAHEKAAGMLDTSEAAQETTQNTDAVIIPFVQKDGNPAYLIAQLAKAGHTVAHGTNKDYFVGKWGLIRHCPDFAALENFARQLGVAS